MSCYQALLMEKNFEISERRVFKLDYFRNRRSFEGDFAWYQIVSLLSIGKVQDESSGLSSLLTILYFVCINVKFQNKLKTPVTRRPFIFDP